MNSSSHVFSPRTILTLLILAQVLFLGIHQLWQGLAAGLIAPLSSLLFGETTPDLRVGPFNLSIIISSVFVALFTIIIGTLLTVVVIRLTWRFIARTLPENER